MSSLHFRVDEKAKRAFARMCSRMNRKPSDVLREMVIAANEGRLKIQRADGVVTAAKEIYSD